ncbi:34011_t:CDS:2, partial [Gigaspora margarita]
DCLDNTFIVRGSVEHFAYVRTLRKIGSGTRSRPRSLYQAFLLRNMITKLSNTIEFSESQREELIRYKTMVYSLNNKRQKRITTFLTEIKPSYSPIVMNYRPSYVSTKVLTIFDETLNKLVIKDLPLARRRKRLSKTSISNLTNKVKSLSPTTTTSITKSIKYLDNALNNSLTKNYNGGDSDDSDNEDEDDVPLFVLKEQFKYSGRGCAFPKITNVICAPSVEENIIPSSITLAI